MEGRGSRPNEGKPRKIEEVFDVSKSAAYIARTIIRKKTKQNPTYHEVSDFINQHIEAIKFVTNQFKSGKTGISRAAVQAAITRAYYHIPKEVIERFVSVMHSGVALKEEERSIIMLRDTLLTKKGGGTYEQDQDYGKTERALWAYWNSENSSRLYAPTRELFPLPEARYKMKIPTTLYPAALTRNIYLAGIDIHTLIIELQRGLIDLKPWPVSSIFSTRVIRR